MAVLYIAEYGQMAVGYNGGGAIAAPFESSLKAEQTVAIGGTTTQSSAFSDTTVLIRVHTDAICSIAIGSNPTATTGKKRMAAGTTEYFGVTPGHKIAVISNT